MSKPVRFILGIVVGTAAGVCAAAFFGATAAGAITSLATTLIWMTVTEGNPDE